LRFKQLRTVVLACAILLGACGCQTSAEREHANQQLRFTKLIDERRYGEVIQLIESDSGSSADASLQGLLGMAYLGRGGFEPVRFGSQVLAAQSETDANLERLIPDCDSGALKSPGQLAIRCVLKRIWTFLPDPDGSDFAKAKRVLEAAYPQPENATAELNTLIGTVEAASALARMERLIVRYESMDPSKAADEDVVVLFKQIQLTAADALKTVQRAHYSVRKISQLLTGLEQEPLFSGEDVNVQWIESTGLPLAIQFATDVSDHAQALEVKAVLLQILDQILAAIKESAT
jgi:hypothetical protein